MLTYQQSLVITHSILEGLSSRDPLDSTPQSTCSRALPDCHCLPPPRQAPTNRAAITQVRSGSADPLSSQGRSAITLVRSGSASSRQAATGPQPSRRCGELMGAEPSGYQGPTCRHAGAEWKRAGKLAGAEGLARGSATPSVTAPPSYHGGGCGTQRSEVWGGCGRPCHCRVC